MGLLVNTKDDLSLAVVLNVPERGLDSRAFTTLKHAARNEDTSFFLVRLPSALICHLFICLLLVITLLFGSYLNLTHSPTDFILF